MKVTSLYKSKIFVEVDFISVCVTRVQKFSEEFKRVEVKVHNDIKIRFVVRI